jgi:hypothetical protein
VASIAKYIIKTWDILLQLYRSDRVGKCATPHSDRLPIGRSGSCLPSSPFSLERRGVGITESSGESYDHDSVDICNDIEKTVAYKGKPL